MHQHIINASLQVVPIVQDKHPYRWVDEAITIIQKGGIKYEVGPFATVVEGTYDEVMKLIYQINDYLQKEGCAEWILNVQLHLRSEGSITAGEKTVQFR